MKFCDECGSPATTKVVSHDRTKEMYYCGTCTGKLLKKAHARVNKLGTIVHKTDKETVN